MLKNTCLLVIQVAFALSCAMLVGCGTKGPLYIPEQRYPQGAERNSIPIYAVLHALQANTHKPFRPALECFIPVAS